MTIRHYEPSDLPVLARLFTDTVRTVNARDYSAEQIEVWVPEPPDVERLRARLMGLTVFVAEAEGQLAGFASLGKDGHFDHLYVHRDWLGRGVGTALCKRVEQEAMSSGVGRVFTEASITARPFFERMGFRLVAEQTVEHRGMKFLNYRMEKGL